MCLIVSGKENKFIAKEDITVYKKLRKHSWGYVTSCLAFLVKPNSYIVPEEGKIGLKKFGEKYSLESGVIHAYTNLSKIILPGIYFEAIIKKGTKFWIQDDLTEIAAEKLYLTDKEISIHIYKPTDFSDYFEEGVDVYLKDGRRCKITDSFDKKDVIGVYGYDNQVIALEYKVLQLFKNYPLPGNPKVIGNISKAKKDLDGYGNTKQLKSLDIKSEALDYCESLGENWYIPSLGELIKLFKNQLRINLTLKYLGKKLLPFSWFWSSTLKSSKYAWDYRSDSCDWYDNSYYGFTDNNYYILPFLKIS